jgi:hypothetical protein
MLQNFFLLYFTNVRNKQVFGPGKPLQLSLMLASKAGVYRVEYFSDYPPFYGRLLASLTHKH